ncbi:MAG: chorismate synthase, partial [Candidatus Zixiibacteriota bacterium]
MLTYLTAGESHGPQLTAILDGLPAHLPVSVEQINYQLARRQKGYGRGGRMKIESDKVNIRSGLRGGKTMGGPLTLVIVNRDWENWQRIMDPTEPLPEDLPLKERRLAFETTRPRPGHADLPGGIKWHHHDLRNVLERASARETAARVAVGSVARQLLEHFDIRIASHVVRIGSVCLPADYPLPDIDEIVERTEVSEVRCVDDAVGEQMKEAIRAAKKKRDSLGGIAEVIIRGLPAGLGGMSQWSDRLDGRLAGAMMSIQSVKGVEIGKGFEGARLPGSQFQDEIFYAEGEHPRKKGFYRRTNNAGGLEGGMTNGEDVV